MDKRKGMMLQESITKGPDLIYSSFIYSFFFIFFIHCARHIEYLVCASSVQDFGDISLNNMDKALSVHSMLWR